MVVQRPPFSSELLVRRVAHILSSRGCCLTLSVACSHSPLSMYQNSGGSSRFFLLPPPMGDEGGDDEELMIPLKLTGI